MSDFAAVVGSVVVFACALALLWPSFSFLLSLVAIYGVALHDRSGLYLDLFPAPRRARRSVSPPSG